MTREQALKASDQIYKIESLESFIYDFDRLCENYESDEINPDVIKKIRDILSEEEKRLNEELKNL